MIRRLSVLLLAAAVLLSAVACSKPSQPELTWNGQALVGVPFSEVTMGGVVVHYAAVTGPALAESLAARADAAVKAHMGRGWLMGDRRVAIWVVPAQYRWPLGLAAPPPGRAARAAAPLTVVTGTELDGLVEAIAVAVTQGAGSPALAVDWLHEGMGGALSVDSDRHPGANLKRAVQQAGSARAMLELLKTPSPANQAEYAGASLALATLVMDRWGVAWADHYTRAPAEMTPEQALVWATGAPDLAGGLRLWQDRLDQAAQLPTGGRLPSMADMSPVRAEPKLDRLPPGPGPNANYSPHAYAITARYDPGAGRVSGEQQVTWQNGESIPIDTLYFNLWPNAEQYAIHGGGIGIQSVTVDGKAVAHAAQALDLTVPLGRAVAPGESVTVEISFTTRVPGLITDRVFGQTPDRFNLAHWFPILAVLDDRGWNLHAFPLYPGEPYSENANFHVTLDVPAGMVVVATGRPVRRTEAEGRWRYEWTAPNVKDWLAAGGRGLVEATRTVGDVTIRSLDADPAVLEPILAETERALKLFATQFGPYPYPDLVVVPCCAGLEFPGLVFTESPDTERGDWWYTVLYHELAHQWFYGSVGNDQYAEAWLDEGFARYGERFALRAFGIEDQLREIRARSIPPEVRVNSSTQQFHIYGGYTPAVYDLGAVLLEDLEALLGPEPFRRLLQTYTAEFRFKTATTADFIRLAEAAAGRDLTQFFRQHKVEPGAREPYRPVLPLGSVRPR